jgi:hypothetical protein
MIRDRVQKNYIAPLKLVPSRITMLEGNIDWLADTPFPMKSGVFYFIAHLSEDVRGYWGAIFPTTMPSMDKAKISFFAMGT